MRDIIRRWREGEYSVTLWDTGRQDHRGQTRIGYELRFNGRIIFEGEDFSGSPLHADDSDETLGALLSFLSLRPGDTDAEYFEEYTTDQLDFVDEHGEMLALYAFELTEGGES